MQPGRKTQVLKHVLQFGAMVPIPSRKFLSEMAALQILNEVILDV